MKERDDALGADRAGRPASQERPAAERLDHDDPEPEWAAEIQRLRRARGDRLRRVFSSFDDEQEEG